MEAFADFLGYHLVVGLVSSEHRRPSHDPSSLLCRIIHNWGICPDPSPPRDVGQSYSSMYCRASQNTILATLVFAGVPCIASGRATFGVYTKPDIVRSLFQGFSMIVQFVLCQLELDLDGISGQDQCKKQFLFSVASTTHCFIQGLVMVWKGRCPY